MVHSLRATIQPFYASIGALLCAYVPYTTPETLLRAQYPSMCPILLQKHFPVPFEAPARLSPPQKAPQTQRRALLGHFQGVRTALGRHWHAECTLPLYSGDTLQIYRCPHRVGASMKKKKEGDTKKKEEERKKKIHEWKKEKKEGYKVEE